jgi:hypothetical protein
MDKETVLPPRVPDFRLASGTVMYTLTEAQCVIAGYAFGETDVTWKEDTPAQALAGELGRRRRRKFSYKAYDCVEGDPSKTRLTYVDVLLTAGIESKIDSKKASQVMAFADEVSECLKQLEHEDPFWSLPQGHMAVRPAQPAPAHYIWRAWEILDRLKWSGLATSHKVLHHKDPYHFPMADSVVEEIYNNAGIRNYWLGIHQDLDAHSAGFQELEDWFEKQARVRGEVRLTRLRLHDILLWTHQTKDGKDGRSNRDIAAELGEDLLANSD